MKINAARQQDDSLVHIEAGDSHYYVNRVHDLEKKFGKEWFEFLRCYDAGEYQNADDDDVGEFVILCDTFADELWAEKLGGKQGQHHTDCSNVKPERCSGFSLCKMAVAY